MGVEWERSWLTLILLLLREIAFTHRPNIPNVAHGQGFAVLIEHRFSQPLCPRTRLRRGGRPFVGRRVGDVVINQVGRRLDMVFRGWLSGLLLPALQEGFHDRLVGVSECLRDNLLGLQIDAKYGSVSKDVAASVAVTFRPLGRELMKTHRELRQYNFLVGLRNLDLLV